eukprot:m.1103912 g.1103912  ORF g.1103912 m.1103912 type:complete len:247 (-) comp24335_c0_seq8:2264-3004(-)
MMLSLQDILQIRAAPLTEKELWALCCVAADSVALQLEDSVDSQGYCTAFIVSPATMNISAQDGNVTFVTFPSQKIADLWSYLPPEVDVTTIPIQTSESTCVPLRASAMVFSLAASLFMAADYGLPDDREAETSEEMEYLLSNMSDDDVSDRIELDLVADLAADGLILQCDDDTEESEDTLEIARKILKAVVSTAMSIRALAAASPSHHVSEGLATVCLPTQGIHRWKRNFYRKPRWIAACHPIKRS